MLDSLTSHSRPAATALGESLDAQELGLFLADSPTPDSALDGLFAASVARPTAAIDSPRTEPPIEPPSAIPAAESAIVAISLTFR